MATYLPQHHTQEVEAPQLFQWGTASKENIKQTKKKNGMDRGKVVDNLFDIVEKCFKQQCSSSFLPLLQQVFGGWCGHIHLSKYTNACTHKLSSLWSSIKQSGNQEHSGVLTTWCCVVEWRTHFGDTKNLILVTQYLLEKREGTLRVVLLETICSGNKPLILCRENSTICSIAKQGSNDEVQWAKRLASATGAFFCFFVFFHLSVFSVS